jgi:galactitol-specific phosphotransferase system IIC component
MQRGLISQEMADRSGTLLDVASVGWAALVTISFAAHILGVPEPGQAVEMYFYPLVVTASVVMIVLALIRPSGDVDE